MMKTVVEVRNLTKVFDGREVLRGCNLTVQSGRINGLLGANDAGKTTTFKLITGLLSPLPGALRYREKTLLRKSMNSFYQCYYLLPQHCSEVFCSPLT